MLDIESILSGFPTKSFAAGDYVLTQGQKTDSLFVLINGCVKVMKDDYEVDVVSEKGSVFGEMSILLDIEHSASVQCRDDSTFYQIQHPTTYLKEHPDVIWHVAQILALRLFNVTQYLVDVKRQYEGHDHLHMVDDVLETLLNQQKSKPLQREDSKRETPDY